MRFAPITTKFPHFLHGGDYNPEQWLNTPGILDEDMRLARLAHVNTMSVGIFSWVSLEPQEGQYDFAWLDEVMYRLAKNNMVAVLATPSGARPAWLSAKYPEVMRVDANRVRDLHGGRHNHCYTSLTYREKTQAITSKLAKRYHDHPALAVWHISNEYGGECHCELCQDAFRSWLQQHYDHDLDKLNHAWWTRFWSHTYTDWSQIESPSSRGEVAVHGLTLDWKRFVTDQTVDFMKHEMNAIRQYSSDVPVTTNMMGTYTGINYWRMAQELDVVSWDSYPAWHGKQEDWYLAANVAFVHDINRSLKAGKPFMLMESTPSTTNWQEVSKLKRPGMHLLSSLQAVAHGADTVQYFQWRKSRGSSEKFHGAVVDHVGHEHTRVFQDVTEVGMILEQLDMIVGTTVPAQVAIIYDWENRWAIDDAQGPRQRHRDYQPTCEAHYRAFWRQGIPVDVIAMDADFSKYKILIAPMLYMVREKVGERVEEFVRRGGTFVTTYGSGIADEHDLCFLGGFPGPLRNVTGVWVEETDSLYDGEVNHLVLCDKAKGRISKSSYEIREWCDLIHAETADILAVYGDDFYQGRPVLTANTFGQGCAYFIGARTEDAFLVDFYKDMCQRLQPRKAMETDLPLGVTAQVRTDGQQDFVFIMNFTRQPQHIQWQSNVSYLNVLNGNVEAQSMDLPSYGVAVLTTHST